MTKRPARKLKFSIMIVCEGEKTEPLYFSALRNEISGLWPNGVNIVILPEPSTGKQQKPVKVKHKTKRKKRKLKETANEKHERKRIEEEYKTIPVRFVREAQQGLEDGAFDEVWAVFDHDNHPGREAAFQLSEKLTNNKKVNIAFSSRAFEHWILLHFEKNSNAFRLTQCKNKSGKPTKCNETKGCKGKTCLWGKLRKFHEIAGLNKSSNLFEAIKTKTQNALVNAIWLRQLSLQKEGSKPVYERNPYTNVDRLVRRLFFPVENIKWINYNENLTFNNIIFRFEKKTSFVAININNQSKKLFIVRKNSLTFISKSGKRQIIDIHINVDTKQTIQVLIDKANYQFNDGAILTYEENGVLFVLEV